MYTFQDFESRFELQKVLWLFIVDVLLKFRMLFHEEIVPVRANCPYEMPLKVFGEGVLEDSC